jgi:hypothetical protein
MIGKRNQYMDVEPPPIINPRSRQSLAIKQSGRFRSKTMVSSARLYEPVIVNLFLCPSKLDLGTASAHQTGHENLRKASDYIIHTTLDDIIHIYE